MATAIAGSVQDQDDELTRVEMHEPRTIGERIADRASAAIGSWPFIIVQTIAVVIWVTVNLIGFALQWDPYPFILLNLMFSVQAAYTGPILLLAGNRQAAKDRAMAERDDEELGIILKLQQEQMQILDILKQDQEMLKLDQAKHTEILEALHANNR
ncbi:MAG TPA: DUF1003 domain-containing protein [Chloroflexota bacterium]